MIFKCLNDGLIFELSIIEIGNHNFRKDIKEVGFYCEFRFIIS